VSLRVVITGLITFDPRQGSLSAYRQPAVRTQRCSRGSSSTSSRSCAPKERVCRSGGHNLASVDPLARSQWWGWGLDAGEAIEV